MIITLEMLVLIYWFHISTATHPTLYVRNSGCDVGICSSSNTDYAVQCALGLDKIETFSKCCNIDHLSLETTEVSIQTTDTTLATQVSTCATVDYAIQCLLGIIALDALNTPCDTYNGQGQINIAEGVYNISSIIYLAHNQRVILSGKGPSNTKLLYNTETLNSSIEILNSYLKISDLTLSYVFGSSVQQRVSMDDGATFIYNNVIFEAINGLVIYEQTNNTSVIIFNNCVFQNNDAQFIFYGVNVTFINCSFIDNTLTTTQSEQNEGLLIIESQTSMYFLDCTFRNAENIRRPLVSVYSGSLIIERVYFGNITCDVPHNSLIFIHSESSNFIHVSQSVFENVSGFEAIVYADPLSTEYAEIAIESNRFDKCDNTFDIYGGLSTFLISDSQFLNGNVLASIAVQSSYIIQNTNWYNYKASYYVITKHRVDNIDNHNSIDNITMSGINGKCIHIAEALSVVKITNSRFQDIFSFNDWTSSACPK